MIAIAIAALGAWLLLGVLAVAACIRSGQTDQGASDQKADSSNHPMAVNF